MDKQNLPGTIGEKMNVLGFTAGFMDARTEAWIRQRVTGYIMISAHDAGENPRFPNNNLHAPLEAKVWSVVDCDSNLAPHRAKSDLTLEEAIAQGAAYEAARAFLPGHGAPLGVLRPSEPPPAL